MILVWTVYGVWLSIVLQSFGPVRIGVIEKRKIVFLDRSLPPSLPTLPLPFPDILPRPLFGPFPTHVPTLPRPFPDPCLNFRSPA